MTAGNPRLGQTPPALTSLGAVGGARGVSAGALRIFVEFITRYDKQALAELEGDLRQAEFYQKNSQIAEEKRLKRLGTVRKQLAESDLLLRGKADAGTRKEIRQIDLLAQSTTLSNRKEAESRRQKLAGALQSANFSQKEIDLLLNRTKLTKEQERLERRQAKGKETQNRLTQRQVMLEGQISKIQGIRANFLPKLQGLAIGAIGGIFGGAILGVGFQLAQSALEKLGDVVQDLIDPARHAREAMEGLAKAVNDLADQKKITQLQAASEIVASFGIPKGALSEQLATALAQVAAQQKVIDGLLAEAQALDVLKYKQTLDREQRVKVKDALIAEAKAAGTYREELEKVDTPRGGREYLHQYIGDLTLEEAIQQRLNFLLNQYTDEAAKAEQATRALADAQQLAAAAQDKFAGAIQTWISQRQALAAAQIEGISNEPSARTKSLEAAIERLQGGGGGNAAGLRANSEERALILLRQRLRLLGANIDLEKFSGKFLLEAINAKIAAIQKEGDEQDRLNSLLDHQYNITKEIRRQSGESIADFVERRAQEQRQQLAEGARLEREQRIASLEDQKTKVEDEVALAENAQARKDLLVQSGTSKRLKELQKQLDASRKADAKETANKKKAIEDRLKAEEEAAQKAVDISTAAADEKFRAELRAIQNVEDLLKLSAEVQGRRAALTFLQAFGPALVNAGIMGPRELSDAITRLMSGIAAYEKLRNYLHPGTGHGPLVGEGFQHGGILELKNSRSPFGQNIRTGEGGTEIGVILSNRVAAALKQQARGADQIGPFNLYGSVDPLGDTYRFKRMVKEAVQEALR